MKYNVAFTFTYIEEVEVEIERQQGEEDHDMECRAEDVAEEQIQNHPLKEFLQKCDVDVEVYEV